MSQRGIIVALCVMIAALTGWVGYLLKRLRDLEAVAAGSGAAVPVARERLPAYRTEADRSADPPGMAIPGAAGPAGPHVEPPAFSWSAIESDDYETYIRNLRSIGCPEETVRDIVLADLNQQYSSRRGRLLTPEPPPYWKLPTPPSPEQQAALAAELERLDSERVSTIRKLLGVEPSSEQLKLTTGFTYTDNRLGNLPPAKQDQASLIREEFNEKWRHVQAAAGSGDVSPDEITRQLRELDGERLARLAQILSPAELTEHELQTSWTSIQLRQRLAGRNPTEAEFRLIYEAQKEFDNEFVHYFNGRTDEPAMRLRQQQERLLNERLRLLLGEQRYDELMPAPR